MTYDAFTLLKNEVKVMKNREASIKKKIKDRKKSLISKTLTRTKTKIAKASIAAVPFIGTTMVIGLTHSEIQDYCNDIKEYKEFEKSLFGDSDDSFTEEENAICGYDYNSIKNIVSKDAEEYKNSVIKNLDNYTVKSSKWLSNKYIEVSNKLQEEYNEFWK